MSDEGVFAVHRGVFKHPIFASEPYTEREAWLWMLGNAAWEARRIRIKDSILALDRGQLAYSLRFLAKHWRWSKSKVDRFLLRLKTETMIETKSGRDATLITICNYDEYQFEPGRRRDAGGTPTGTQAGHARDKEKELNNSIKEESLSEPSSDVPKRKRLDYPQEFEGFWTAYPTDALMSKKQALDAWKRLTPDDRAKARSAVPAFSEHCRKNPDYRPLHAVRFLSQRRFDGFAATPTEPPAEQSEFMRSKGYEWTDGKWQKVAA